MDMENEPRPGERPGGISDSLWQRLQQLEVRYDDPAGKLEEDLPAAVFDLLQRSALVRLITPELYRLLASSENAEVPPFAEFCLKTPVKVVRSAAGEALAYQLPSELRQAFLTRWRTRWTPETGAATPLVELCRRLLDHLSTGTGSLTEQELGLHLVLHPASRGAAILESSFHSAFSAHDLVRCENLLYLEDEWTLFLTPAAREVFAEAAGAIRTRYFWASEFARTATYYVRGDYEERLKQFVSGEDPSGTARWVFPLVARGGVGKTMLLHWLAARWSSGGERWRLFPPEERSRGASVPVDAPQASPLRVPCIRIDFDAFHLDAVGSHSRAFCIRLAQQLAAQLPDPARKTLTGAIKDWSELGADAPPSSLFETMARCLQGQRLLLLLDTIEEPLLDPSPFTFCERILGLLDVLKAHLPRLRVILSGRRSVGARLQEWLDAGETLSHWERWWQTNAASELQLAAFNTDEADAYLDRRGSIVDAELRQEVVRRFSRPESASVDAPLRILPFTLALLHELAREHRDDPEGQRRTLLESGVQDPDLLYLIERIVDRVPNRWLRLLLRYGAVPRKLSREFVSDIFLPNLPMLLKADRREQGLPDTRRSLFALPGEAEPGEPGTLPEVADLPDADTLWKELYRYATTAAWVASVTHDRQVLTLHPEVLNPIRRNLLWGQPVARELHQQALRYYEQAAQSAAQAGDREGDLRATQEAVFHRFQLDPEKAPAYWRAALERREYWGDPSWRAALADELRGSDYVDKESNEPLCRADGTLLIAPVTLAEAHMELGRAALDAGNDEDAARWLMPLRSDARRRSLLPAALFDALCARVWDLEYRHRGIAGAPEPPSEDEIRTYLHYHLLRDAVPAPGSLPLAEVVPHSALAAGSMASLQRQLAARDTAWLEWVWGERLLGRNDFAGAAEVLTRAEGVAEASRRSWGVSRPGGWAGIVRRIWASLATAHVGLGQDAAVEAALKRSLGLSSRPEEEGLTEVVALLALLRRTGHYKLSLPAFSDGKRILSRSVHPRLGTGEGLIQALSSGLNDKERRKRDPTGYARLAREVVALALAGKDLPLPVLDDLGEATGEAADWLEVQRNQLAPETLLVTGRELWRGQAILAESYGALRAAFHHWNEAVFELGRAAEAFRMAGDTAESDRVEILRLEVLAHAGQLRPCDFREAAAREDLRNDPRLLLLEAEERLCRNDLAGARACLAQIAFGLRQRELFEGEAHRPPLPLEFRVRLVLARLEQAIRDDSRSSDLRLRDQQQWLEQLTTLLAGASTPRARLHLLRPLRRLPALEQADEPLRDGLLALVSEWTPASSSDAPLHLALMDLQRVLGNREAAAAALQRIAVLCQYSRVERYRPPSGKRTAPSYPPLGFAADYLEARDRVAEPETNGWAGTPKIVQAFQQNYARDHRRLVIDVLRGHIHTCLRAQKYPPAKTCIMAATRLTRDQEMNERLQVLRAVAETQVASSTLRRPEARRAFLAEHCRAVDPGLGLAELEDLFGVAQEVRAANEGLPSLDTTPAGLPSASLRLTFRPARPTVLVSDSPEFFDLRAKDSDTILFEDHYEIEIGVRPAGAAHPSATLRLLIGGPGTPHFAASDRYSPELQFLLGVVHSGPYSHRGRTELRRLHEKLLDLLREPAPAPAPPPPATQVVALSSDSHFDAAAWERLLPGGLTPIRRRRDVPSRRFIQSAPVPRCLLCGFAGGSLWYPFFGRESRISTRSLDLEKLDFDDTYEGAGAWILIGRAVQVGDLPLLRLGDSGRYLSPRETSDILYGMTGGACTGTTVLLLPDGPGPSDPEGRLRETTVQSRFARELFEQSGAQAVLAVRPSEPVDQPDQSAHHRFADFVRSLCGDLAEGRSLAELAERARSFFGAGQAALFCEDPGYVPFPPSRKDR